MFGDVSSHSSAQPQNDPPSVLVADSQNFFRAGLRDMLEAAGISVVGEASTCAQAVALSGRAQPHTIVIDPSMPGAGVGALSEIAKSSPSTRIVVLSAALGVSEVLGALAAGADAYLLKSTPAAELVRCIGETAKGQVLLSREVALILLELASSNGKGTAQGSAERSQLTDREIDVLRLIAEGADNAAIGVELSISRHTVKQHVTNILAKLGARTRAEAAVYAVRTGLL